MNKATFFNRLYHSLILRRAAIMLVALGWSSLAFCGEIHDAAKSGDLEKVKALLKDNPDLVYSKDDNGWTPLHNAARYGHKDVAGLLLANRAEVNAKTSSGATPLHLAVGEGYKDMVELLLADHADVNAEDNAGDTALFYAANEGRKDLAEMLLTSKADVNAKNMQGSTPLHIAAFKDYKDVAELLLANHADVNAQTQSGDTPLRLAGKDVLELLRQHGGVELQHGGVELQHSKADEQSYDKFYGGFPEKIQHMGFLIDPVSKKLLPMQFWSNPNPPDKHIARTLLVSRVHIGMTRNEIRQATGYPEPDGYSLEVSPGPNPNNIEDDVVVEIWKYGSEYLRFDRHKDRLIAIEQKSE